jgi:hypothetical protein
MTGLPRKLELITILRDIYALEQKYPNHARA